MSTRKKIETEFFMTRGVVLQSGSKRKKNGRPRLLNARRKDEIAGEANRLPCRFSVFHGNVDFKKSPCKPKV